MTYKIIERVDEGNWCGDFPTENNKGETHRFKNKDELIAWLIDNFNGSSNYYNLEMIE